MPDIAFDLAPASLGPRLRRIGPARVTAVLPGAVELCAEGVPVRATLAVAGLYAPAAGDEVLAIETDDAAWVIGVLRCAGPMTVRAAGDLRFEAPQGSITLAAGSIRANATEIRLTTTHLHLAAERLRERFRSVQRIVTEALDVDAGSLRTRVRDTCSVFATRLRATATEDVKIDGKQIHLG